MEKLIFLLINTLQYGAILAYMLTRDSINTNKIYITVISFCLIILGWASLLSIHILLKKKKLKKVYLFLGLHFLQFIIVFVLFGTISNYRICIYLSIVMYLFTTLLIFSIYNNIKENWIWNYSIKEIEKQRVESASKSDYKTIKKLKTLRNCIVVTQIINMLFTVDMKLFEFDYIISILIYIANISIVIIFLIKSYGIIKVKREYKKVILNMIVFLIVNLGYIVGTYNNVGGFLKYMLFSCGILLINCSIGISDSREMAIEKTE